jgi:hypothetical protein
MAIGATAEAQIAASRLIYRNSPTEIPGTTDAFIMGRDDHQHRLATYGALR